MSLTTNRRLLCACAGGLFALLLADVAQAYPSRAGNCAYCHDLDDGELDIQGFDLIATIEGEDVEVFEVAPGGSMTFIFEAVEKGEGRYGIILNGLDLLNEEVQYTPRLYTPDPDWSSARNDEEYLHHYGRYYSTGLTEELQTYEFDLTVDPTVKPGTYVLSAMMAGGYPSLDMGWTAQRTLALHVTPEPTSLALLGAGLLALGWRRTRPSP